MTGKLAWIRLLKVIVFGAISIILTYIGSNVGLIVPESFSWATQAITTLITAGLMAWEKYRKEDEKKNQPATEVEKITDDVLDKVIDNMKKKK